VVGEKGEKGSKREREKERRRERERRETVTMAVSHSGWLNKPF